MTTHKNDKAVNRLFLSGCLDVQAFERLLGPCKEIMKRNVDLYAKELEQVS